MADQDVHGGAGGPTRPPPYLLATAVYWFVALSALPRFMWGVPACEAEPLLVGDCIAGQDRVFWPGLAIAIAGYAALLWGVWRRGPQPMARPRYFVASLGYWFVAPFIIILPIAPLGNCEQFGLNGAVCSTIQGRLIYAMLILAMLGNGVLIWRLRRRAQANSSKVVAIDRMAEPRPYLLATGLYLGMALSMTSVIVVMFGHGHDPDQTAIMAATVKRIGWTAFAVSAFGYLLLLRQLQRYGAPPVLSLAGRP